MKVETTRGPGSRTSEINISDIPNVDKLTNVDINLTEGTVNLYYEGWRPVTYSGELITGDEMSVRYDGELDDPDHPRPRPVKDNPQA